MTLTLDDVIKAAHTKGMTMDLHPVIQFIAHEITEKKALSSLRYFALYQDDSLGGRVYYDPRAPAATPWKMQSFFSAEGVNKEDVLPDGCRFCIAPAYMLTCPIRI